MIRSNLIINRAIEITTIDFRFVKLAWDSLNKTAMYTAMQSNSEGEAATLGTKESVTIALFQRII